MRGVASRQTTAYRVSMGSATDDSEIGSDATTHGQAISRRATMKAAVAGGAAAVAWSAPRVEGFSVVPDFAAAASCVSGNSVATFDTTRRSKGCTFNNCCDACVNPTGGSGGGCSWAGWCNGSSCGNQARTGTLSIPRTGGGGNFDFNYSFLGSAWNGQASLNGALSGVDPPFVNCGVVLNGSCADQGGGGGCSFGTGSGASLNGNGNLSTGIDFNCNGILCSENNRCNNNSITLSLTLSCTCT